MGNINSLRGCLAQRYRSQVSTSSPGFNSWRYYSILDAAEIYQRHDLECEELKYADQTHQVLGLYCKKYYQDKFVHLIVKSMNDLMIYLQRYTVIYFNS